MKQAKRNIDKVSIEWQNNRKKESLMYVIKLAEDYRDDLDSKDRRQQCLCKVCYYNSSRIGGSAVTNIPCAVCEKDMVFGNTCTDVLCIDCAKINKLCKHCGADIDYVNRRKREDV